MEFRPLFSAHPPYFCQFFPPTFFPPTLVSQFFSPTFFPPTLVSQFFSPTFFPPTPCLSVVSGAPPSCSKQMHGYCWYPFSSPNFLRLTLFSSPIFLRRHIHADPFSSIFLRRTAEYIRLLNEGFGNNDCFGLCFGKSQVFLLMTPKFFLMGA